jgi:hypothetical protein
MKHEVRTSPSAVSLTAKVPPPPWGKTGHPELICAIPGILDKQLQTSGEKKHRSKVHNGQFTSRTVTHAYKDGSAKKATENGGGGVYIQLTCHSRSFMEILQQLQS